MIKKLLLFCLFLLAGVSDSIAQCPVTVLINDGATSGNARCPQNRNRFARSIYLVKASEFAAAGITSGKSLSGIGWNFSTASGTAATAPLKVYLQNTADATNLKSTTYATAITGMTLVHNATTTLPAGLGAFNFPFSGGSAFTYSGGSVYVAFDWGSYAGTLGTTAVTSCNSTGLVNGLLGAQSTTTAPTTLAASSFRPETSFIASGSIADAEVTILYTMGELPLNFTSNHQVRAVVKNNGPTALTNFPVTLTISGANSYTDVQTVASLASCGGSATVTFAPFTPTALGSNTVTVSIPADANNTNNSKSRPQTISTNGYNYRYPGATATGGVGNSAPLAFANKFSANSPLQVQAVNVDFNAVTATTYKVIIYADNGAGLPGAVLYVDAADRTVTTVGTQNIVIPAATPANVGPGDFYVGILQTNSVNMNLAYETESPIRSGAFYLQVPYPSSWFDMFNSTNTFRPHIGIQVQQVQCLGTPTPGNTIATQTFVCPNTSVILSLQNVTPGAGTTYQWESADDAGFTSNVQSLGTNQTQTVSIVATKYFRCNVDCAGDVGTSTPILVQMNSNPCQCAAYCVPTHLGTSAITNVSIGSINNTTSSVSPFVGFETPTTTLNQGNTYPLSVTTDASAIVSVWFDWNNDLVFSPSEWSQVFTTGTTATINISIPMSASIGNTRMRIRSRASGNSNGSGDACTNMGSGELEDYCITIGAPIPCSGTPTPGNAIAASSTLCAGNGTTISLQNLTNGTGVTYQWYDAITNSPIGGATNSTYVTPALSSSASFYCIVDCGGNQGTSSTASITVTAIPMGSSISNPIIIGQAPCAGSPYTDTRLNTTANCYSNSYTGLSNQASPDVWYQFTLAAPATVNVGHCGTGFDTYIHLLDNTGALIAENDDFGPLCTSSSAGSITQALPAGTYYIVSEGYSTGTGSILTTVYTNNPCSSVINLKCFIEGYYTGSSTMTTALANEGVGTSTTNVDEISVSLKDATTFANVATTTAMLQTNGTATATFSTAPSGSFYIAVSHRNALETWSATPQTVGATPLTYDFTTASTKAYTDGSVNNMREIEPGVWAFWSGDIFKDGVIDGSDGATIDNDSDAGVFGYFATDLNGDGSIDGSDYPFFNNNSDASIYSQHP